MEVCLSGSLREERLGQLAKREERNCKAVIVRRDEEEGEKGWREEGREEVMMEELRTEKI